MRFSRTSARCRRRRRARSATRSASHSTPTATASARLIQGAEVPLWGGSMRAAMKLDKKSLSDFAEDQRTDFESTLKDFVEIPSVSSEPERLPDIRRMAERAAKTIADFGGEASILETNGNALVHGRFDVGAGAPTVTRYKHPHLPPPPPRARPSRGTPIHLCSPKKATAISAAARPTTKAPRSRRCGAFAPRATPACVRARAGGGGLRGGSARTHSA